MPLSIWHCVGILCCVNSIYLLCGCPCNCKIIFWYWGGPKFYDSNLCIIHKWRVFQEVLNRKVTTFTPIILLLRENKHPLKSWEVRSFWYPGALYTLDPSLHTMLIKEGYHATLNNILCALNKRGLLKGLLSSYFIANHRFNEENILPFHKLLSDPFYEILSSLFYEIQWVLGGTPNTPVGSF